MCCTCAAERQSTSLFLRGQVLFRTIHSSIMQASSLQRLRASPLLDSQMKGGGAVSARHPLPPEHVSGYVTGFNELGRLIGRVRKAELAGAGYVPHLTPIRPDNVCRSLGERGWGHDWRHHRLRHPRWASHGLFRLTRNDSEEPQLRGPESAGPPAGLNTNNCIPAAVGLLSRQDRNLPQATIARHSIRPNGPPVTPRWHHVAPETLHLRSEATGTIHTAEVGTSCDPQFF